MPHEVFRKVGNIEFKFCRADCSRGFLKVLLIANEFREGIFSKSGGGRLVLILETNYRLRLLIPYNRIESLSQ